MVFWTAFRPRVGDAGYTVPDRHTVSALPPGASSMRHGRYMPACGARGETGCQVASALSSQCSGLGPAEHRDEFDMIFGDPVGQLVLCAFCV